MQPPLLLWRSFHFYAHHPFPRHLEQTTNLDFDAFQRAALLTVFQCDSLLGTRELDWFWRRDATFFHNASFARVFRSLAAPEMVTKYHDDKSIAQVNDITTSLSDAMDVLVMVGPQYIHAMPPEKQLEDVARRLFISRPAVGQGAVRREDISTLIDLLLRTRLDKKQWSSSYHYGHVLQPDPASQGFTKALVAGLMGDESKQSTIPEELLDATGLLPNLPLRFQQLWAVLFQPPMAAHDAELPRPPAAASSHIIEAAISLFLPRLQFDVDFGRRLDKQDSRIILSEVPGSMDSYNLEMSRLTEALSPDASEYIVIFTGDDSKSASKAIIGVYLATALSEINLSPAHTMRESAHVFFQLQPVFRLLRDTRSCMQLADLVNKEEQDLSLAEDSTGKGAETPPIPYWIGHSSGQGPRLEIDPKKRTATLISGDAKFHANLKMDNLRNFSEANEFIVSNARMSVFVDPFTVIRTSSHPFTLQGSDWLQGISTDWIRLRWALNCQLDDPGFIVLLKPPHSLWRR
ncbi:hypothetical protein G7054_g10346 [Neopestalotiopsis clavispora]|nr:hypothetical protein G7054_g10346 [Neopestalotiopsis clavispora]